MSNIRLFTGFNVLRTLGQRPAGVITRGGSVTGSWSIPTNRLILPFQASIFTGSISYNYASAVGELSKALTDGWYRTYGEGGPGDTGVGPSGINVRYNNQTNRVIIFKENFASTTIFGPTEITFNEAAQKLFGFPAIVEAGDPVAGQTAYTGSNPPFGVWTSTQPFRAKDTDIREADSFIEERLADSGKTYSIGRPTVARERNWSFINEPKVNVFKNEASNNEQIFGDATFTFQDFVETCRANDEVFVLVDNNQTAGTKETLFYEDREAVYKLKPVSMNFRPQQLFPNYEEYWNLNLQCHVYDPKYKNGELYPPGTFCPLVSAPVITYPTSLLSNVPSGSTATWEHTNPRPDYYNVYLQNRYPGAHVLIGTTTHNSMSMNMLSGSISTRNRNHTLTVEAVNQCGSTFSYVMFRRQT